MKQLIYLLLFCFLFSAMHAQQTKKIPAVTSTAAKDRLGVSGPLQFNKTNFNLAWSDKPNETYYVQEYVPKGENVEHFNQLLTINVFNRPVNLEDAAKQKINELNERKKIDPDCNYAVSRSKDGKEFMIDFLLSEGTGANAIVEFNIYHYKQIITANNKPALIIYAYSKRSYGDATTGFLKNLKTERPALLQAMSTTQMPQVKISDK